VVALSNGYGFDIEGTGSSDITSSTINANQYGVYSSATSLTLRNSIVTNNTSVGIFRAAGTTSVTYSDVWGNGSNYGGVGAGTGTISANPQYSSAPSDLHLTPTSVCIDAAGGSNEPAHDRDDVTRPLDGDGIGGTGYDMGAYEYVLNPTCGD